MTAAPHPRFALAKATMVGVTVSRYKGGRFWSVCTPDGTLVCVCVYKRGAHEVKRLLEGQAVSLTRTDTP